jgi:hypothetical protein
MNFRTRWPSPAAAGRAAVPDGAGIDFAGMVVASRSALGSLA